VKVATAFTEHLAVQIDPPVNVTSVSADQQSATDLKDFADTGYNPLTHKVAGVGLTDECTALTGHTAQTGDSFARIGANGAGLTDLATVAKQDAIKTVTDNLPDGGALTTIGTDTARLTAVRAEVLTDWVDGGRLDLLLDSVITALATITGADGVELATGQTAAWAAALETAVSDMVAAMAGTRVFNRVTGVLTFMQPNGTTPQFTLTRENVDADSWKLTKG